jgi:PleD family two-component response regulator
VSGIEQTGWRHLVNIGPRDTKDWGLDARVVATKATDQVAPMPAQRRGQTSRPTGTSLGQLPLAGKSVLIIEDEALIAMNVESCLQDAGAAVAKNAESNISNAVRSAFLPRETN